MGELSKKLRTLEDNRLVFWCPGCGHAHQVRIGAGFGSRWTWNGDVDRPTFAPSINIRWSEGNPSTDKCCHSNVTDGMIKFYSDSTHKLSGQTVPLPDFPTFLQEPPNE